jgi:hypothetical protein
MPDTSRLEDVLDTLHARVTSSPWLSRLTAVTRGLLAIGFIKPSLVKILGKPFTSASVDTPVGHFFDAMYRTGDWWRFIGLAQLTAGLLLPRRAATVGALLYLPIILNIFIITVSVGFTGTPVITGMMLLAVVYLVCWDYPRWKSILFEPLPGREPLPTGVPVPWMLTLFTALGVEGGFGTLTNLLIRRPPSSRNLVLLAAMVGLGLFLWVRSRRQAAEGTEG